MRSKNLFTLSILLLCLSLFISCTRAEYSDTVACHTLSDLVKNEKFEYEEYDEEYLKFFFEDTSLHDDFCIIYTTDTNDITEIGIFHTPDEDSANKLLTVTESYISEMQENQRAFIGSYAPEELPKLDGAEIKRFGNYLVYSISDNNSSVFSSIEKKLEK